MQWLKMFTSFSNPYSPGDQNQLHDIKKAIEQFEQQAKKLKEIDNYYKLGYLGIFLYWNMSRGLLHAGFCLAGACALNWYANTNSTRQQEAAKFNEQLENLLAMYRWCAKGNGARITYDEGFQKILTALLPHLTYERVIKDIKLWKLDHTDPKDICPHFLEMLAKSHRIIFVKAEHEPYPEPPLNNNMNSFFASNATLLKNIFDGIYGCKEELQKLYQSR